MNTKDEEMLYQSIDEELVITNSIREINIITLRHQNTVSIHRFMKVFDLVKIRCIKQ